MLQAPRPLTADKSASIEEFQVELQNLFSRAKNHRLFVESDWDESYEMWRSSALDTSKSASRSTAYTGKEPDWHHRVSTGKFYETVETLVSYFDSATFPSEDWFDIVGTVPELGEIAKLVKTVTMEQMRKANVRLVFDDFYRSLFIHGFSTIKVGWQSETKRLVNRSFTPTGVTDVIVNTDVESLVLEHVSPRDIWVDTSYKLSATGTFRALHLSKAEFLHRVETGEYTVDEDVADSYNPEEESSPGRDKSVQSSSSMANLVEYYGPLVIAGVRYWCVHAVMLDNKLIALGDSPYWCGSPYLHAVLLPNRDSIYGMSTLHPLMGGFHVLNTLTNMRLDAMLLHINKMFTMVEDGILRRDEITSRPGAVYAVASHDNLKPMDMGSTGFMVSYNEESVATGNIDRATATGPLIGSGQPRTGERVTAQEIAAVKDAGGMRLTTLHIRLEEMMTYSLISKVYSLMQQYIVSPQTVRMFDSSVDGYAFFNVLPEYFMYPYEFKVSGADYVVGQQRNISDLLTLLDITGRVPQLAQSINYQNILQDLLKLMRFAKPDRYINQQPPVAEPQPQPQLPGAQPELPPNDQDVAALQQALTLDGGAGIMGAMGIDTEGIDPLLLQQILGGAINDTGDTAAAGAGTGAGAAAVDPRFKPGAPDQRKSAGGR